ncbi:MAG: iron-containing alcohol dehydrogenase [Planctomycetes bacterium]|nr:iron-containing alcohol dehydrogenase [Planctomycetota bacterium]
MNQFGCSLPGRVEFGSGKLALLPEWIAGKTVLLLSDAGVQASGCLDAVLPACREAAAEVVPCYDTPSEPSEDEAAALAERFRGCGLDAVVAIGGGSVLDMAKIIAVLTGSEATVADLFAGTFPDCRRTALYMVPTTAGTGAEATPNAILYRPALRMKVGIVCSLFVADRIILDPDTTLGLPPAVTAATGMDALCHAVECLVSNKANPLSDVLAEEAIRLIFATLRTAYRDGTNREARASMLLASFYAGLCIACAGTNIVHALSYPLGGRYRIPHGVSNAILLATAMAYNRDAAAAKLAALARFLPGAGPAVSTEMAVERVLTELAALARDVDIPRNLGELGVPAGDLDVLVEDALTVRRLLDNNPREVSRNAIRAIYAALME